MSDGLPDFMPGPPHVLHHAVPLLLAMLTVEATTAPRIAPPRSGRDPRESPGPYTAGGSVKGPAEGSAEGRQRDPQRGLQRGRHSGR